MKKPSITIGIPTFNRRHYLKLCLESCLNQKFGEAFVQIVVSNNGSSDGSAEYLSEVKPPANIELVTLDQQPIKPIANWKACLDEAKGEYFLLLSDDDLLEPNFLHEVFAALQYESEEPAGILVGFHDIDSNDKVLRTYRNRQGIVSGEQFLTELVTRRQRYRWCAFVARTSILRESEVFKVDFPGSGMFADGAGLIACCARGPILRIHQPLVRYRLHGGNDSKRPDLPINHEGRETFVEFSEGYHHENPTISNLVKYWCADGYYYQLIQWLVRRHIGPSEMRSVLNHIRDLSGRIRWKVIPRRIRNGFWLRYGLFQLLSRLGRSEGQH